ncbi:MAG: CoF synthetase, partial [Bacteroidota bacterium]|nr:CoF synthetase [Bacteroidota bacterium]
IISFAEKLKDSEKSRMAKYFNAPVFERYSNQENGIMAQQTLNSPGHYVLNWGSYHFEFLGLDNDFPVKNGELGRVVVTDLFNHAMPMIRYDTGDLAVHGINEEGAIYLTSIEGRRIDQIFDSQGNTISSHFLYMILEYGAIKQFQFIQKGEMEYQVKLNALKAEVDETKIISYCKSRLGNDAVVTFEYVDEIPLLASGKRKKIVNEHKKS